MHKIKNTVLAVGAGAYALFAGSVQAASLGDIVHFDFTGAGTATSLVDDGNQFTFTDSTGVYDLTVAGYGEGGSSDYQAEVLVHSGSDYSEYGYNVDNAVVGLGVCGAGDAGGSLSNCLRKGQHFAVDNKSAAEWVLFTAPDLLQITAIEVTPTVNKAGQVNIYAGTLTGSASVFDTMTPVTEYNYGRNAGPQLIDLDPILAGSVLVGNEAGTGRYTITGLYAQVVPVPASVWLMLSGLSLLFGIRRKRL